MLFEISIVPLGAGEHISGPIAEAVDIIRRAGLPYRLTPSGTCVEGEWDRVMEVIKDCHDHMRSRARHVITEIRIEDDEGAGDMLRSNVAAVEEKLDEGVAAAGRDPVEESSQESFPASDPPSWTQVGLLGGRERLTSSRSKSAAGGGVRRRGDQVRFSGFKAASSGRTKRPSSRTATPSK